MSHTGREAPRRPPRSRACRRSAASAFLAVAGLFPGSAAPAQEIDPARLRETTRVLAHDSLEGRGTASRGEERAARYLAERLAELGLVPLAAADDGFELSVPLVAFSTDREAARLTIRVDGDTLVLEPPDFYHPGGAVPSFRDFSGSLLYGGPTPGALDALEGLDLTGRVVLIGPPWDAIGEVETELLARGAAGALEAVPSAFYDRLRVVRGPTRFALRESVDDPVNQSALPRVVIGPRALTTLGLAGAVDTGGLPAAADLPETWIEVRQAVTAADTVARNVAALLPGTDPARSSEIVMYVAHYDHVGFGEATAGDSIWNGFVDNAAGTAMLLEIGRALARDPPPRPVAFLFTTAEEQGLLGATWFVHRPPVPLAHIRAVVNLDGGSGPAGDDRWRISGPADSRLRAVATEALRRRGAEVGEAPPEPTSDHWAFHAAGIPAFFFLPAELVPGAHPHTPDDEWSASFPFDGMVSYAQRALELGRALSDPELDPDDP